MLFNSPAFLFFFMLVFAAYWSIAERSARAQNGVLFIASLVFYGWADLRFMGLLLLSAAMNFGVGLGLVRVGNERTRTVLFWAGIAANLGVLLYFKYFNFFYESFVSVAHAFGSTLAYDPLHLLLPLGVSFFTFQTVGYLIDVRNEQIDPCRDPLAFFTYVFYFPKMLAGPIEPAQKFLPQVEHARVFDSERAVGACRQVLWGLFAKVVVADQCGRIVDPIFHGYAQMTGTSLLLGAFIYFIQIYADFSGYSNMAIGISRLLGIELMRNFAMPMFVTGIGDFWRRWHISLSSWMMDRLFTPLSFILRAWGRAGSAIAISLTFLTVGIWHGANWTFVLFGVLQSLYFIPLVLTSGLGRTTTNDPASSPLQFAKMLGMFLLMALTFVLLRTATIGQALHIWSTIFSPSLLEGVGNSLKGPRSLLTAIAILGSVEWIGRKDAFAIERIGANWAWPLRWTAYWALAFAVLLLGGSGEEFIYFQF